jgi:hypothetical protein
MKNSIPAALSVLIAGSLLASEPTPKAAVLAAAKKLGDSPNYAWKAVVVAPEDAPLKPPSPTEGKTEKGGLTHFTMTLFEDKIQVVAKGDQRAMADPAGNWKSLAEAEQAGLSGFGSLIARGLKTPAKEVAEIAAYAKELKREGDVFSSDLTEAGAKALQSFRRSGTNAGPVVSDAKGSVTFWLKDGTLTKYEVKLKGRIKVGDDEFPNDRTTTVEIKDVGTTKVEVPEEARKRLP